MHGCNTYQKIEEIYKQTNQFTWSTIQKAHIYGKCVEKYTTYNLTKTNKKIQIIVPYRLHVEKESNQEADQYKKELYGEDKLTFVSKHK